MNSFYRLTGKRITDFFLSGRGVVLHLPQLLINALVFKLKSQSPTRIRQIWMGISQENKLKLPTFDANF